MRNLFPIHDDRKTQQMSNDSYYHVYTLSKTLCDPLLSWYSEVQTTWLCPGCRKPKPMTEAVDAYLDSPPPNAPLNGIQGTGVGVIRKDFLAVLGDEVVRNYLMLGKVFDSFGKEQPSYATFLGKQKLYIRGNEDSTCRICEICGQTVYFPLGPNYLMSNSLTGVPLYQSNMGQLIVDERLHQRIKQVEWKRVGSRKLPVLNQPKDGRCDL